MFKFNNKSKGFTLIELLVVIAIIAILAGVVVVALDPLERVRQSRDSRRVQDLERVRQALDIALTDGEIVLVDNTGAPGSSVTDRTAIDATDTVTNSGWVKFTLATAGGNGLSKYIPALPDDPQGINAPCQGYEFASDGSGYELRTCFETTKMQTDMYGSDGGDDAGYWEIGNDPGLDLMTSSAPTPTP